MANRLSFRSGQIVLQKFRVESSTVIEAGDMLFLDETVVRPAKDLPWNTNLATTQEDFAAVFAGIAHEPSASGQTAPVSIDISTASVYEFVCTSSTYDNGNTLGPEAASSKLLNQQLAYVSTAGRAIARAAQYAESMVTRLRVTFASAYSTSSSNVNASIG
ncbi:MAG: hypothetical protein KF861_08820 [Planctomycetaceae bacterium]|nr:hypothetical protein [Planctomycetaceae bacterium]